jgi:hypothetical protein
MPPVNHTIEELNAFIAAMSGCDDGIQRVKDAGIYGLEFDEAIEKLRLLGLKEDAAWLKAIKKTEAYVRYNGKEITMSESYQIFNPMSGQHVVCADIESAKALVLEVQKGILKAHAVTACRELRNENGDTAWISVDFPYEVNVDFK